MFNIEKRIPPTGRGKLNLEESQKHYWVTFTLQRNGPGLFILQLEIKLLYEYLPHNSLFLIYMEDIYILSDLQRKSLDRVGYLLRR